MTRFAKPAPVPVRDPASLRRLAGTKGPRAAVGAVLHSENGNVCWDLHPAYAAWLWPLMQPVTGLALSLPESALEPLEDGDALVPPRAPTEAEKDKILKMPETAEDSVRVYTLVLRGKPASVHKAFPTRTANLTALRYCRRPGAGDVETAPASPLPTRRQLQRG